MIPPDELKSPSALYSHLFLLKEENPLAFTNLINQLGHNELQKTSDREEIIIHLKSGPYVRLEFKE